MRKWSLKQHWFLLVAAVKGFQSKSVWRHSKVLSMLECH
jgi:hypothetical protein